MAIITLEETKTFLGIATAETNFDSRITALIPVVTDRVRLICHREFTVQPLLASVFNIGPYQREGYIWRAGRDADLYILPEVFATFDASAATATVKDENFATAGFASGQNIYIKGSYLNDGYFTVDGVSTSVLTIASTYSAAFAAEATGAAMFFAVVKWPVGIKPLAASLIQFDYQDRGRWHDGDSGGYGVFGYPKSLLQDFQDFMAPAYGWRP